MKKTIALLSAILVLVFLCAFSALPAVKSDHDCPGEHCFVCVQLEAAAELEKHSCAALITAVVLLSIAIVTMVLPSTHFSARHFFTSVDLKTKLSI